MSFSLLFRSFTQPRVFSCLLNSPFLIPSYRRSINNLGPPIRLSVYLTSDSDGCVFLCVLLFLVVSHLPTAKPVAVEFLLHSECVGLCLSLCLYSLGCLSFAVSVFPWVSVIPCVCISLHGCLSFAVSVIPWVFVFSCVCIPLGVCLPRCLYFPGCLSFAVSVFPWVYFISHRCVPVPVRTLVNPPPSSSHHPLFLSFISA